MPASSLVGPPGAPGAGRRVDATPGLGTRVAQTFLSPARLFATFGDASPWIGVLAISTAVAMAAAAFLPPEYFLADMQEPVNRLGKPVEISSSPQEIVRWGRYQQAFNALAIHPLTAFGLAGLLMLVFSVFHGGRASFRQYLAVASHALLIPAAGTIVGIAMRAASGDASAAPTVGRILSFAAPVLRENAFLDSLNVFSLWMLLVLAVAVAVLDGRPSWIRPATALLGVYLLLAGATVLIAT